MLWKLAVTLSISLAGGDGQQLYARRGNPYPFGVCHYDGAPQFCSEATTIVIGAMSIGGCGPLSFRWPDDFPSSGLQPLEEVHTPAGKHKLQITPFPDWVPKEVQRAARQLTEKEAASQLAVLLN